MRNETAIRRLGTIVGVTVSATLAVAVLMIAVFAGTSVKLSPIAAARQGELLPALYAVLILGTIPAAFIGYLIAPALVRASRGAAIAIVLGAAAVAIPTGAAVGLMLAFGPGSTPDTFVPMIVAFSLLLTLFHGPIVLPICIAVGAISAALLRRIVRASTF